MSVKLLTEHHLEFLSFKAGSYESRLYTCQNVTLLEITCPGSFIIPVTYESHCSTSMQREYPQYSFPSCLPAASLVAYSPKINDKSNLLGQMSNRFFMKL